MCLAIPGKVLKIEKDKALVDFSGIKKEINISLIEKPKIGDYLIVHTGFAIQKIDKKDAFAIISTNINKKNN